MNIRKHLDSFSKDLELIYNSENTRNNYYSQVKKFLYRFKDEIEPKAISNEKIKSWLLESETINTRKHRLCALVCFYKNTIGMPMKIGKIPYPKKEHKLPIVLSVYEVQGMFDVCENLKHKTILALLYSSGLRVSELINLKWSHIDRARGVINILSAKGKKDRQVPLPENLIDILESYWKEYKTKPYVFSGQFSDKYSSTSVNKVVKQLAQKAGINKRVYTHLMRHNAFTHMVENGIDINLIQKIAGHSSAKTTAIYTHISHNMIKKIESPLSKIKFG